MELGARRIHELRQPGAAVLGDVEEVAADAEDRIERLQHQPRRHVVIDEVCAEHDVVARALPQPCRPSPPIER